MAGMPNDPRQRTAILVGLIAVLGAYAFREFWVVPGTEEIAELEARVELMETRNREARILATRGGDDLEERLAVYEGHLQRLETLIPRSEELATLLDNMAYEARRTGVGDISALQPIDPVEEEEFYTRTTYQLEVRGDFDSVGRFLTSIASLERVITPVNLELESLPDEFRPGQVLARFQIQTYVLPDRLVEEAIR